MSTHHPNGRQIEEHREREKLRFCTRLISRAFAALSEGSNKMLRSVVPPRKKKWCQIAMVKTKWTYELLGRDSPYCMLAPLFLQQRSWLCQIYLLRAQRPGRFKQASKREEGAMIVSSLEQITPQPLSHDSDVFKQVFLRFGQVK